MLIKVLQRVADNMDIKKPFGHNVKAWRNWLGISQEQLAERAGLHRTYVCDVERGMRNVSLESIEKLARALEISISHLLSGIPDAPGGTILDILLVEDLSDDVELTRHALQSAGIANRIQVARDGAEALGFLLRLGKRGRQQPSPQPQLILLDLKLPQIDGLEVLRQIKADSRTQHIPVIVLTSSTDDQDIAECQRLGASAFISKPVSFYSFSKIVPQLCLQWALVKAAVKPAEPTPQLGVFHGNP
jgi:CheY-like chemotaxis protein/DNA-binding XRE family transcriptional regulator